MAFACCVNVYMVSVHTTRAACKENPDPNPITHTITAYLMSYVCAYLFVQLDKRRVERVYQTYQVELM